MPTRREFIQGAGQFTGAAGLLSACLQSIDRARALEPTPGSTYLDAEHVVILMQENRSFDHAFGTLRGVRGFNDPRAITLANGLPVWVQTTASGEHYAPFRLDLKNSKSTWMGDLPHHWTDQVDARNHGLHDKWLQAKRSHRKEYARMPLTLGHYTRADIPFYYALADAFTICDQHFCSGLTATTPNRLFLWSGTIRERQSAAAPAMVRNEEVDYLHMVNWKTFPERLEDLGISWKVYQNELTLESGLNEHEDAWLGNFGDNPLEWFAQFKVGFAATHRSFREKRVRELPGEIDKLKKQLETYQGSAEHADKLKKQLAETITRLQIYQAWQVEYSKEKFDALTPREKSLHVRAFSTNTGDPNYRKLNEIHYRDGDAQRSMLVPAGDVLHQFRQDVSQGNLPTVSWLVSPKAFSDHPSSAWYGSWYISEVLNILTHNPKVWKKTVFILTYDENDGQFDHVPPFVTPHPRRPETGRVTKGIDASVEYVELEQDRKRVPADQARESSIGLGYRVPMVIASPWSRGGCVCSQVFDHTSVLQFLETLLTRKTGKKVEDSNITRWRRAVCGDLTAAFQASPKDAPQDLPFASRDAFLEEIHRARFKNLPGYRALSADEVEEIRRKPHSSKVLVRQETGVRNSSPLPYELVVDGSLNEDRTRFNIRFEARKNQFGERAAGSPFVVYARHAAGKLSARNYAIEPGAHLEDSWSIADFDGGNYHLQVYGPNGFCREFTGNRTGHRLDVRLDYARGPGRSLSRGVEVAVTNLDASRSCAIELRDNAYKNPSLMRVLDPGACASLAVSALQSYGWYDLSVRLTQPDACFEQRYAGRIETGEWSISDPVMGGVL